MCIHCWKSLNALDFEDETWSEVFDKANRMPDLKNRALMGWIFENGMRYSLRSDKDLNSNKKVRVR